MKCGDRAAGLLPNTVFQKSLVSKDTRNLIVQYCAKKNLWSRAKIGLLICKCQLCPHSWIIALGPQRRTGQMQMKTITRVWCVGNVRVCMCVCVRSECEQRRVGQAPTGHHNSTSVHRHGRPHRSGGRSRAVARKSRHTSSRPGQIFHACCVKLEGSKAGGLPGLEAKWEWSMHTDKGVPCQTLQ